MLSQSQKTALKAAIEADPVLLAAWQAGDPYSVAAALNQQAVPDFTVWRTSVTKDEIYANGFDWVQIDNVTDAKWRVWIELFSNAREAMNPSKSNVRAGVLEVWKGTAQKVAVGEYVLSKCKRLANRVERIMATGTGTTADPATMQYEGAVGAQDVADAMQEG